MNLPRDKAIYTKILLLGLPILISQLGGIVVGFTDTTMVGQYSTDSLAAASFVNNVFNVAMLTSLGYSFGLTPIIGTLFAQKRQQEIGVKLRSALVINLTFTLVLMMIMGIIYLNLHRLGQPEHLLPIIRPYYLMVWITMIPLTVFNVFSQWSYAINRTSMPMWIILAANTLNIVGNYLLIEGHMGLPELGLNGAGLATMTARFASAAVIVLIFFTLHYCKHYRLGFHSGKVDFASVMKINLTSWPVALQMCFESSCFTFSAVMAGWLGDLQLAAYQVIVIFGMLGFCVYYSIGAAVSVLVSNAAGMSDNILMRRTAFSGYVIMMFLTATACAIFYFGSEAVVSFFTPDPALIALALTLIGPLMLYQLADATQITFANALRGTTNVRPMIWIAFTSYVIVGLPTTYLMAFTFGMGLYGIILSFSVSLLIAAILFLYYFLRTTRTRRCVDNNVDKVEKLK